MKKMLIFFLSLLSLLLTAALIFQTNATENRRLQNIEMTSQGTHFYISDSDRPLSASLAFLTQLSEQYEASIVKTSTEEVQGKLTLIKAGIYAPTYYTEAKPPLAQGSYPKAAGEFLATFETQAPKQTGRLRDLFHDLPVMMVDLATYSQTHQDESSNGQYALIAPLDQHEKIFQELADFFETDAHSLQQATSGQTYDSGTLFFLTLVLLGLVFALYLLLSAFYPISELEDIGVMKLLGFKERDIWLALNRSILLWPIIIYLLTLPLQALFIPDASLPFFFWQGLGMALFFLLTFVLSVVMLAFIRRYHLLHILKHFFNARLPIIVSYTVKFGVLLALIGILPQTIRALDDLHAYQEAEAQFLKRRDQMTLSRVHYGSANLPMDHPDSLEYKMGQFFQEVEQTAQATFLSIQTLNSQEGRLPDQPIFLLEGNEQYLQATGLHKAIPDPEETDENALTYYVPQALMAQQPLLLAWLKERVANNSPTRQEEPTIKLIPYEETTPPIFAEDMDLLEQGVTFIQNPIIHRLSPSEIQNSSYLLTNTGTANPMRIQKTPEHERAIAQAIQKFALENFQLEFLPIADGEVRAGLQIARFNIVVWLGIIGLTFFLSWLASYYIFTLIAILQKQEMLVKRLLGFTLWARYRADILLMVLLYGLGLVETLLLARDGRVFILYGLVIIVDALLLGYFLWREDQTQLVPALKGER